MQIAFEQVFMSVIKKTIRPMVIILSFLSIQAQESSTAEDVIQTGAILNEKSAPSPDTIQNGNTLEDISSEEISTSETTESILTNETAETQSDEGRDEDIILDTAISSEAHVDTAGSDAVSEIFNDNNEDAILLEEEGELFGINEGESEEDLLKIEMEKVEDEPAGAIEKAEKTDEKSPHDDRVSDENEDYDDDDIDDYERDYDDYDEDYYDDEDGEYVKEEEEVEDTLPPVPVVVEKTRSVNFAKNLKEYRSPRKAMFLSLLLPGLGQAYAKTYWKTAIFGSIEAALVATSISFAVRGKQIKDKAHSFADKHYNNEKFVTYFNNINAKLSEPDGFFENQVEIQNQDTSNNSTEVTKDDVEEDFQEFVFVFHIS